MGELARNLIFGRFGFRDGVNADTLEETGIYYMRANTINAMDWSYLVVFKSEEGNLMQINFSIDELSLKIRACSSSSWRDWRNVLIQ